MAWSNPDAVRSFFLNHTERLTTFIPAAIGPEATTRLNDAIMVEQLEPDALNANLDQAAALLDIAGETALAASVRAAKPKLK